MNAEYLYRKSWTSSKSPTSAHISQRQTSKDIKMPAVSESHESSQRPDLISIPQLSPDLEDADRYSVQAVVTLVWPFSSSNRVFSLLLAEPDFRLRNQNGQIRVTFSGRCAEEVACTKVGIGDTVTLSLQGAQWTENQKTQSTPGKSLAWELQYKTQVKFEATRNGKKIAALDFEQPASPKQDALNDEPTTPALFPDRLPSPVLSQERWETPAFMRMKRLRSRSPVPSSTYDIFAEEDGYIPGLGRKRLRFSFPSSEWRLLNEPDDRTEDLVGNDENWFDSDEELLGLDADADGDMASAAPTYEAEQPTGTIPHTSFAGDVVGDNVQLAESDTSAQKVQIICDNVEEIQIRTSFLEETAGGLSVPDTRLSFATPRLDPIASSTLPTPSPLVYTPIDSPKPSNGASSNIPTSQPQSSHTGIINSIDDNTHSNVSSDAYNKGPSGVAESDESDAQTRTDSQELKANFQSVYVELNSPAIINDRNSLQSTHEQPLYLEQTRTNEFAGENDDKSTASDADGLENMNETEGDGDGAGLELIQGGRIGQSEGESTNAYHSVSEDGAEGGLGGSESEDVDDETSLHAEIIEVDDSSPVGHRREFRDVEKDENGESDFEGRCFSDDVEGDEEDIMSEQSAQSDTGTGYEEGSADEAHQGATASRTAHRIVHPEVIVLDSDSEDEPHIVAAPSTKNGNDAVNDTENSSHIDDDDDRSTSWGVDNLEERNEYSEGEEEEETDEEMVPSETDIPEYENTSDEHMLLHDVYDLGETGYAQAEEGDEHDAPTNGMDEILSSQSGPESVTPRFDTPKVRSTPSATSNTSSVDNDMAREEQENGSLVNTENIPDASNDFGVKEAPGGQIPVQERVSGSTHLAQQLAYRNVSPLPVSTPPSTVNEKLQYNHLESTVLTSSDHDSSPSSEVAEPEAADGNRHRRWIDGSDERPLRDSDRRLSTEENTVHHFTEEDEIASEKLDEVVLVEDHISRPTGTDNHPVDEIKQCDFQNDLMPSIVETTKPQVYYSLATLVTRLHRPVDVIAVVVDASPAELSTTKTEGYDMRLRVTDGSMAGTTVIVNIFHPTEASLPRVTEGDAVLLHAFEVQTHNSSIELLSSDESGWAVIRSPADLPRATHSNVVFGEYERVYAEKLQNWFREDGAAMAADHMLQLSISQEQKQPSPFSAASSDAGSLESSRSGPVSRPRPRRRKSHRRVTIHELRDGRRYTEFGWLDSDSIHELRDGTVYAHSFGRDG